MIKRATTTALLIAVLIVVTVALCLTDDELVDAR
jgi:hypothetical protein